MAGRSTRTIRAPRPRQTFWTVAFSVLLGFLLSELKHREIGPFRDLSWKNHREPVPRMTIPPYQPREMQPVAPPAYQPREMQPVAPPAYQPREMQPVEPGAESLMMVGEKTAAEAAAAAAARAAVAAARAAAPTATVTSAQMTPIQHRRTNSTREPWSERDSTSSLLMYVGHMRGYESSKYYHNNLVRQLKAYLKEAPTVCIVTYSSRDHEDSALKDFSTCVQIFFAAWLQTGRFIRHKHTLRWPSFDAQPGGRPHHT